MDTRHFTWMRQVRPIATFGDDSETVEVCDTWECYTGPALYDDGGPFVVLDSVPDLEYVVVDSRDMRKLSTIRFDFREAYSLAHEANRSEERYLEGVNNGK